MGKRKKTSKQDKYTFMVLKLLKEMSKREKARLSIREVGRILEINPMAVSRAIKRLEPVLDVKRGSEFESFRLPLKLIRLKENLKHLSMSELIKRVKISKRLLKEVY